MAFNRIPGQNDTGALSPDPEAAFVTSRDTGIEELQELGVHTVPTVEEKKTTDTIKETPSVSVGQTAHDRKKHEGGINDDIIAHIGFDEEMPPGKGMTAAEKVNRMSEIALYALHVEDDPTLNPWTIRTLFLGVGLSCFSATLATIYQFKPQSISLSTTFLCVVSYVLSLVYGLIPRVSFLKWLNPHPMNIKEHTAILIMCSTAAHSAMAVEVIATQRLWYNKTPNAAICIFLTFASQTVGYGVAGLLRKVLVYPTKFVFPVDLPLVSLLETFHRSRQDMKPQLRIFYWAFTIVFFYEVLPEYIMPVLTAVSIFCLAKRDSMTFTRLFGGGNGNEGLGFLSACLDFQYVGTSALYLPPLTTFNYFVGYILCISVFMGIFYGNIWSARDFPFLSQLLFTAESNATSYQTFNQSAILNAHGHVNETLVMEQGLPYMTATYAVYVLTQNMAVAATIMHLFLNNWDDLKLAWSFAAPSNLKTLFRADTWKFWLPEPELTEEELEVLDPHYRKMLVYKNCPNWWYMLLFVVAAVVGLICIYEADSGMAWWAFFVAVLLSAFLILFTGAQYGLTGYHVTVQPIIQMIGAYIEPGRPVTNMYFTLFGYNSVSQGLLLLQDLKLAQYAKLSPRCTFTMQLVGTLVGSILNYFIMVSVTTAQREILLSIEGTHIWSGASLQSFNTQAITWGGLAKYMYSWGSRYEWVPIGFVLGLAAPLPFFVISRLRPSWKIERFNVPIICGHIGWLVTGINSGSLIIFLMALWSQYWLRRYKPEWFLKFNYVLSAGIDGGTSVIVFILTFAVFGASGREVSFPSYWGNNANGNIDYCMTDPGN